MKLGRWKQVEPKDATIVALTTQINNLENKISRTSNSSGGGSSGSNNNKNPNLRWMRGGLNSKGKKRLWMVSFGTGAPSML